MALLLDHLDLDVKDPSPGQKNEPPVALKQLQLGGSYAYKQPKGLPSPHVCFRSRKVGGEF